MHHVYLLFSPYQWKVGSAQRGLRQGDHLSPYIFILCAEVFSCMLEKVGELRLIEGIKIARAAPITHMFFAYDSIIFSKANLKVANTIAHVIKAYEDASGQRVNLTKTKLTYSKNMPKEVKNLIQKWIGVEVVKSYEKYLGLPAMIEKSKKIIFANLQDKLWKK